MDVYNIKKLYDDKAQNKAAILTAYQDGIAEKGIDAESSDGDSLSFGEELAVLAAGRVHAEALAFLFEAGVNPALTDKYGATLLHHAAKMEWGFYTPEKNDMAETVKLLLDKKVSVLRKEENENMTCYHYAARSGAWAFVETLADRGAKLNITDRDGNTGIHIAAEYAGRIAVTMAETEKRKKRQSEQFAAGPNLERLLAEADKDLAQYGARLEDYFKTVKAFIKGGLDGSEKNNYGRDARAVAIEKGAKKIAVLLSGSFSGDEPDSLILAAGGMDLFQAVVKKDYAAMAAILQLGADLNGLCDEANAFSGLTALGIACSQVDSGAAEILLKAGADPNFRDGKGCAALAHCFSTNADLNVHGEAFREKRPQKLVKAMIEQGFTINGPVNDDADTILNLACGSRHGTAGYNNDTLKTVLINELLKHGADYNIPNNAGKTPLMHICTGDFDAVENIQIALLEGGADTKARDRDGNTALHYAANNDSKAGARALSDMLLEFGADSGAANNAGKTALDIAAENDNEELVKLLLSKVQ